MFGIHFVLPRNLQVPLSFQALIVKKKKKSLYSIQWMVTIIDCIYYSLFVERIKH